LAPIRPQVLTLSGDGLRRGRHAETSHQI